MEILLKETRFSIDDGSLAEILRGIGPTIFQELSASDATRFVDWLEKHVSDHVPLTRRHP